MAFIYSTASSSTAFHDYSKTTDQLQVINRTVVINGGAGVAGKHFITPLGVMTEVTDDELAFLETDEVFISMQKNGFITVRNSNVNVEVAVADMETRDEAAPIVPQDLDIDDKQADGKVRLSKNNK